MESLMYSISEVSRALNLGRNTVYEMARQNRLPVLRVGTRLLIPKLEFDMWLKKEIKIPSDSESMGSKESTNEFDLAKEPQDISKEE